MSWRTKAAVALSVIAVAAGLSACTHSSPAAINTTVTHVVTQTPSPSAPKTSAPATSTFKPAPPTTVAPLPPGASPAAGEVEKPCPYIASSPDQNPNVNVADIEGDHVYRTTVLTTLTPVGCRFYFYAGPFEAIADIIPRTFPTALEAYNAMVLTGEAGTEARGQHDIIKGVDGVIYRTQFLGGPEGDNGQDWACVFAKGKVMVIVHTQRTDQSLSVLRLAQALAPRF